MAIAFASQEEFEKLTDHQTVVYKIENHETGDYYFGATSRRDKRRAEHSAELKKNAHCNAGLQEQFNNKSNLVWVEVPVVSEKEAFDIERLLIKECKGDPHLLNVKAAVGFTPERRKKISDSKVRHYENLTQEQKDEISKTHSLANRRMWDEQTDEERAVRIKQITDLGLSQKDKPKSDEACANMSLARQKLFASGYTVAPENIQKMADLNRGKKHSQETNDKKRQSMLATLALRTTEKTAAINQARSIAGKLRGISKNLTEGAAIANSKKITVDGVEYSSHKAASIALNVPEGSVSGRLNSANYPNWNKV